MARQPTENISSEWQDEPDREEFEHAGYRCLILRAESEELLNLNGYVGVARGHPCYGKDVFEGVPYHDIYYVCVHGGLTFSGEGDGKHRPTGLWWLGFDCAHAGDLVPGVAMLIQRLSGRNIFPDETYKNFQYVRSEVKRLANQMAILDFIDWQFTWVWPLLLPIKMARYFWKRGGREVWTSAG